MRVAYLVSRYPTVSHAFIRREIEGLRALGDEVVPFTVVRVDRSELIEAATREEDERTVALRPVSVARLLSVHAAAFARRPLGWVRALRRALAMRRGGARDLVWQLAYFAQGVLLARALAARGVRHVHAHHANVASDVALLGATYDPRLTWSLTLHGPTELADVGGHRLAAKLADASRVACISDFARAQACALVDPARWERLSVVRLGVDLEEFASSSPPSSSRPSSSSPSSPSSSSRAALHVLSVGRLATQKGQPVLLEAIASARAAGADVRLTLVGEGELRPLLEERIRALRLEAAVTLAGAVGHDRIAELYREADAFCLTSFAEGVPVVLMEAMASEVPVVAPRLMGIPELVEDGVSGFLVAPARADLTAEALRRLAAMTPEERAEMGRAGRARVAADYELHRSAREMHDLLEAAARG